MINETFPIQLRAGLIIYFNLGQRYTTLYQRMIKINSSAKIKFLCRVKPDGFLGNSEAEYRLVRPPHMETLSEWISYRETDNLEEVISQAEKILDSDSYCHT